MNTVAIIKYVVTLLVGVGLLYWVFSGIDLSAMLVALKGSNYWWILASVLVSILSHLSRAYRWNLLLKPLGYHVKLINSFQAVMVAYFANLALPRLGEVSRCTILKKTDNIPMDVSIGTVIVERIVDSLVLLSLLALCFVIEFDRLKDLLMSIITNKLGDFSIHSTKGMVLIGSLFIFIVVIPLGVYLSRTHLLKLSFIQKVAGVFKGLLQGLLSIKKLDNKWVFIFHSYLIWFLYFFLTYLIFFALEDTKNLNMSAALVVMVLGALGMAAPVQGGIGTYHIMASSALLIYGIPQERGLILATILHTSQMLTFIVVGGLSVLSISIFYRKSADHAHSK